MKMIKQPPHSIEAEQSVLGGLMLKCSAWLDISDLITDRDFYKGEHQKIFTAIKALSEEGVEFDTITLSEKLSAVGELENAGGISYLVELANNTPSAANIIAYAKIVRERSVLRNIIKISTQFVDMAYNTKGDTSEQILNSFQDALFNLSKNEARQLTDIKTGIDSFINELERRTDIEGLNGLTTGFKTIDGRLKGLKPSKLIVVGARPSQGKTTYSLNILESIALIEKKDALVFSMEMDSSELVEKMMSNQSGVSLDKLEKAELTSNEWNDLTAGGYRLGNSKIFIDDTPSQTWQSIRTVAKKHAASHDLGVIVVDYLQLMDGEGKSPNEIYGAISRNLKKLAKELRIPVILLSQLNRDLEKRPDRRPRLSDLRESGAIEQDADIVQFIYRDEFYYPDFHGNKGFAEIITAKFRGGKTGKNILRTELEFSRFKDCDGYEQYEPAAQQKGNFNG